MQLQTKKQVKKRRMRGLLLLFCMVILSISMILIEQKNGKDDADLQVSLTQAGSRSLYQSVMDFYLPILRIDQNRQWDFSDHLYQTILDHFPVYSFALSGGLTNSDADTITVSGETVDIDMLVEEMEEENEAYQNEKIEKIEPDVTMDFSQDSIVVQRNLATTFLSNSSGKTSQVDLDALSDFNVLLKEHYRVDSTTEVTPDQINVKNLLKKDLTLKKGVDGPQILIYHTHSQEGYSDSTPGDLSQSVVGLGDYLAQILQEQYGLQVIHDRASYDKNHRDYAYSYAGPALEKILEKYPTIEVVIDLHRDGVSGNTRFVTTIGDTKMAQVMFFNGLSYTKTRGKITSLPNENLSTNLAFSQRMELLASEYYPGFTRPIFLKGLRYNMHYVPKSLLVEVGAQTNTLQEAKNAMPPLADLLNRVLQGEKP